MFDSGHRLSTAARDHLLSAYSPEVVRDRAWRFADEPVSLPPDSACSVREATPPSARRPRSMRVDTILMDLWHASSDAEFLLELEACVDGLTHGVNFLFNGNRDRPRIMANHGSAREQPVVLTNTVQKALQAGHSVGPFSSLPWANLQVHPLGLVPKSSGGWRLTEDASFPSGDSVNDWTDVIPQQYEPWSRVIEHFSRVPPGSFFLQWDKADAYRSVPIRIQDQHLTGFFVPDLGFCFSPTMPFGFASSSFLWKRFMDLFILLLSRRLGIPKADMHVWVDDCLLILTPCASHALTVFGALVQAARRYSFLLHPTKFFLSRRVTYLGIVFDSVQGTLSIPPEKLAALAERLEAARSAEWWSLKQLQSLIGSLMFVSKCLRPAQAFIGRLIAVLRARSGAAKQARFRPPEWALEDLRAWLHILSVWSGTALARVRASSPPSLRFHVDAFGGSKSSDFAGVGMLCLDSREFATFQFTFPQRQLAHVQDTYSTLVLEFAAFPLLLSTFADVVKGRVVEVFCDNDGAVAVARKGYHAEPVMGGLCRLFSVLSVALDCHVVFNRVSSQENLADLLSRGDTARFLTELPWSTPPCERQPRLPAAADSEGVQCAFFSTL